MSFDKSEDSSRLVGIGAQDERDTLRMVTGHVRERIIAVKEAT